MPAALFIIAARAANESLRNSGNVAAASFSFASICEFESGSNDLTSCPVAGLMVAIAIGLFRERISLSNGLRCRRIFRQWQRLVEDFGEGHFNLAGSQDAVLRFGQ